MTRKSFVSLVAMAAALSSPAFAQDAQTVELDEIVVTGKALYSDQVNALKSPTLIIDVPQSLSIITAEQIQLRGYDSIGQMIDYTPGVNTSQGEGHRDAVVFRGVRSTADFFIDGVRDDVQYYRPLYNLEQVEILRGPNALLFGRGGTGGLINRVTKKAQVGDPFTGYQASLDTFGAYSAQIDSNFDVNETSAVRVNAMYESLENHRDFYDGQRIGFNPTAKIQLADDTTLDLSYEYADHERFIDRGIPTDDDGTGLPVEGLSDIVFGDSSFNEMQLEAHIFRALLTKEFSDNVKGVFTASYSDYDKLYQNFYAADYIVDTNNVQLDGYVDTTQRETFNLSGNLIGEFETGAIGHTIVTGVEYMSGTNNNDRYNPVFSTTGNDRERFVASNPLNFNNLSGTNFDGDATTVAFTALNDDTHADISVASIFVQDEIALLPNFDLVLGLRYDSFDFEVDDIKNDASFSRTDNEISPRAGLVYKPMENVSLYGSFSQSFLPRSGEQFASINADSSLLDPDVYENLEGGIKWDIIPNLSFTAAYFQNEQTSADRDDDTGEGFEVRGLEVEGVELQLTGQLLDKLFINAGYTNVSGVTDDGAEIPRELPENTFSVWGNYKVSDKFELGLGATYQDESFISDFDIGDTNPYPTLPSYTRFDAAAYYDVSDTLRLQANIENLTDELYFPNSHSTHQATVGAPLNARFSISGKF